MPELPEVETARRFAESHLLGRRIVRARARPDSLIFDGTTAAASARRLTGRRVEGTGRKGKHFWFELDERPWLLLHLGMSGRIEAYDDPKHRSTYWKLELETDDGMYVTYSNKRRIGRIRWRHSPIEEEPILQLGRDALDELPRSKAFHALLQGRRTPVKALLLNQGFLSGIGNWIADEVLYQAGIKPSRPASSLTENEARRLRESISRVVRHAVRVGADDRHFPDAWLFHTRWGQVKGATTADGKKIHFDQVGGRTTAWVPSVQR